MKFLKNMGVRAKLLLMSVPLVIALVLSLVFMGIEMNRTEQDVSRVYYDILYDVNGTLLNADRDFYQAIYAANQYYDLASGYSDAPEDQIPIWLESQMGDYKENCDQVLERVQAAYETAKLDPNLVSKVQSESGKTYEAAVQDFMTDFNTWKGLYDLESMSGDWNAYTEKFRYARDHLNDMQEITETWAEQEHKDIEQTIVKKITALSILFGVISVILIILAIAVIREIRKGVTEATRDLNELASGNLNVELPDDSELGRDEVGLMRAAAKSLTLKLQDIMSRSNSMDRNLSAAGDDLAEATA